MSRRKNNRQSAKKVLVRIVRRNSNLRHQTMVPPLEPASWDRSFKQPGGVRPAQPLFTTMSKALVLATATVLTVSWIPLSPLMAQSPPPPNANQEEPLQMIVTYGNGKETRRESHRGAVRPAGVPAGQEVTITLRFLRKRAGEPVQVTPLDGGAVDLTGPVAVSADGSVVFKFRAGATPGRYRLAVYGPREYEIALYAFDPNRPGQRSGGAR